MNAVNESLNQGEMSNRLLNPAWQRGFYAFRNDARLQVARGWLPWWKPLGSEQSADAWPPPLYDSFHIDGSEVQRVRSPRASHDAGLSQQALVVPGHRYRLAADCKAWSSEKAVPGNLVNPTLVNAQVGIDVEGGSDPGASSIIWCDALQPLGQWLSLTVEAVSAGPVLTVFLRTAPSEAREQQVTFWRYPVLVPAEEESAPPTHYVGLGETRINLDPVQPERGERIVATVTSEAAHLFCDLLVRSEHGQPIDVRYLGEEQRGGRHSWGYEFVVPAAGLYEARFGGDEGARILALETFSVEESEEQVLSSLPIPRLERANYRSTYVLLPPTADRRWFVAAAKGSFEGRYSVGFSADDAGGSPAEEKQVLAVNPHHWPGGLDGPWFENYYPGTTFTAVVAESPEDLEYWLHQWTGKS